jgi:D-proline reductase (dithiol) PrdB
MRVDSFKYLPRLIAFYYKRTSRVPEMPIPWTPLKKPIRECKFGLITSGGIYNKKVAGPFNIEREKEEPTWGDPTYRRISIKSSRKDLGVSHLHINTRDILKDVNILLPINRFDELSQKEVIGGVSKYAYSFMGYQGLPPDTKAWEEIYAPQVARELIDDGVNCVFITPA